MKYLLKLLFLASITTFSAGLLWSDEITSKLYEKYKSSIVRVWAGGHGTGFVINDDGYILTNAHVTALDWNVFDDNTSNLHEEHMTGVDADNLCPNKKRHYVVLREVGGKAYGYRARLIAESRHLDLAIIKVDEPLKDCKPLRFFGENSVPKHGESIFTIGHSGMNDDEQKRRNLIKYMGVESLSDEDMDKYARSVINREFDKIPPEVVPKAQANAIKELIFKLYYKTQLTREEQRVIQQLNLEHILKRLIQKAGAGIVNHMSLQNFVATESCPPIKELPEEFFDLASPACGNAGDIEKIVKVQHWGLDNNGSVLILQHKATTRQGNSGGPMLNMRGEVVGVVTAGHRNDGVNTGLNYASHGDEAMAFLKEKGIKFYRGAGAPNTDIANISLQEKFEAAFGKLIIPKTHEIINGVIVSAKGHMIVPWKENADYSDSILIHKIGEYSFAYKMVPLASDSGKRLTLLKPLAEIKDIPFLELARKEFDKKTQYTIAQQNVNANTLLSDLGVGDFKKIAETLKDGEKINEAAKKQFELKKESATLKSRSKPFFILSGSTMHGAPVIDAANNMAGFIVGASNGGNVALPAAAIRKILEANGVLEASEDVGSYDVSSLFWEDYLKIGAVVVLVCLAILLLVSLARKRSNSLNSQFLTKLENNGANVARQDVEAKSVYIPQKVLEYGTPDLKAKISAAENVIHQIDRILNNPSKIDGINIYKVAREYQQLQQNAIKRLSRCLTLAGLNRKREALQMASAYPSLISIINSLQFDDLEKWRIYCARAGIPAPEQILNSDIEKLNSLIEEMKLMPEDHTQILRKYMAGGEFEKAIELLEIDIALNPKNEALQRQLVSVKNNLLNQKISIISKHAQHGEHKEAVAIFDQLNEIMPQSLKDSSTRWPKMLSYIVSVKRDIAKDIIAETMKALQETDKEDWRKIFDILSVIDANVEGFPDLKDDVNFEITAKKRAEAEEGKAAYVKQMEFEDACGELNKMVSNLSELRDKGKVSKADLLYYLRAAEIKWKKAESYGIEIGEDIANRFSKNIKFVKQEINRIDTIKRRCILSSVGTMVILVASISVILYNRHHKLNAYKEFMTLYRGNDTAETLTSVFTSLKNKYSSYLEHPNFKRIVDDIAGKIGVEKQMESDFKSFVEKCSNPIEETPDSSRVKLLESWIESEYAKLDSHLPQSFKMKLKLSKDRFDGELKKYKIYITHYAEGERDKLLSEINSIFNSIVSDYSKGIYEGEKADDFAKKKKTFADLKYEYVDNVSNAVLAELGEKQSRISEMADIVREFHQKLDDLLIVRNINDFISKAEAIEKFCSEKQIFDAEEYKKINGMNGRSKALDTICKGFYSNQCREFKGLYANKDIPNKTDGFRKLGDTVTDDIRKVVGVNFGELCSEDAKNIYTYTQKFYDGNSLSPIKIQKLFTVGKVISNRKSLTLMLENNELKYKKDPVDGAGYYDALGRKKHSGKIYKRNDRFKGCPVIEHLQTDFEYITIRDINVRNRVPRSVYFESIVCLGSSNEISYSFGSNFEDETKTIESKLVERLGAQLLSDNKSAKNMVRTDACVLDAISEVLSDIEIDENFKIYLLSSLLSVSERYMPFTSGLFYSPSAVKLNKMLQSQSRYFLDIKSWLYTDAIDILKKSPMDIIERSGNSDILKKVISSSSKSENQQPKKLKPDEKLLNEIKLLMGKKISFNEEARLTAACINGMATHKIVLASVADKNGLFNVEDPNDSFVYYAIDNKGNTIKRLHNEINSTKVAPFSPIVKLYTPKAFVGSMALDENISNANIIKNVCEFLFDMRGDK